jgi:imidazolonepropionase-like amidohydrolase
VIGNAQLVIRGVTVVDPRDGSLRAGQDVRVAGERIVSVETAGDGQPVPAAAQVVDADGRYLVPGFTDMHAHPLSAGDPSGSFDLMLAHGATGFRQMSGSARMLKDRAAGTLMPAGAPRLLAMPGTVLTPFNAGSAAAAAATVREQHDLGADFIKAPLVTSQVFEQAQQECRRLGIPILGHLPNAVRGTVGAPGLVDGGEKFSGYPASARQTFRAVYGVLLNLTKVLDEAGVPMLAGSDSGGAAWEVPGLALHQEFDELARAGLSPLRVLQMTTWSAAEFMNATDVMGSVAAGKHADLVLLDANPVESVDHLHRICGVVRGGRYLGPADLDALKEKVAATRSAR